MRTKLIACIAGLCLITTLYITYRLYDLSAIIPQLSIKTAALDERISKTETLNQQNADEIANIGKFVRSQKKETEYESFEKYDGETAPEVYKNTKKSSKQARNKKINRRPNSEENNPETNAVRTNTVLSNSDRPVTISKAVNNVPEESPKGISYGLLNERMHLLKSYASDNSLDKDYALIADLGISSGKKRFYLVDLNKMSIAKSGLVAYSKKGDNGGAARVFRVERTGMEFYELYSLDKNGNVVSPEPEILSPVKCVPNSEAEGFACESDGGPGLSPKLFGEIHQLIKSRKKPMLLWMFK